ncbi:unnamed protein product, partial [Rotaria magnacalcarata]
RTALIRQLENYRNIDCLQSTTLFLIFDSTDLYTMIPRDGALNALARLLNKYSKNRKNGNLSIERILQLARMALEANYFAYTGNYYKQIRGGAMGSPLTMVLANIYIYIDDVFMTTNISYVDIIKPLDEANTKDPNIKITHIVQSAVNFLDVAIKNKDVQLITLVFHKPAAEPCVLPFSSDHPRYTNRNTVYCDLLRVVLICSDVNQFAPEGFNFKLMLIMSGSALPFINHHPRRFFEANAVMNVWKNFDDNVYQQLHRMLLHQSIRNGNKQNMGSSTTHLTLSVRKLSYHQI